MKKILILLLLLFSISCTKEVPVWTEYVERLCFPCDTVITTVKEDTVYGKMPSYGIYVLNDSVKIRVYGWQIGNETVKRKYLKPRKTKMELDPDVIY